MKVHWALKIKYIEMDSMEFITLIKVLLDAGGLFFRVHIKRTEISMQYY